MSWLAPEIEVTIGDRTRMASVGRMEVTAAHGVPVVVPLKNWRHDLPAMAEAVTARTRLLFVCNPNNPTGTMVTAAEVDELMARVPEDVIVVFDEADRKSVGRERV